MQETAEGEDEEVKLLFMHDKETPTEQESKPCIIFLPINTKVIRERYFISF